MRGEPWPEPQFEPFSSTYYAGYGYFVSATDHARVWASITHADQVAKRRCRTSRKARKGGCQAKRVTHHHPNGGIA